MEANTNMTVGQLIGGAVGIIAVLSIFIEITPVKVNPISSLVKWFGKKANEELTEKVDKLEEAVEQIKKEADVDRADVERDRAVNCRIRLLQFGDEIRRDIKHSFEHFTQILGDTDYYEHYCEKHPEFKNNQTVETIKIIKSTYRKCVDNNSFL